MKRLSISLVFVGLIFGLIFGATVGYADTQANAYGIFTLDSVLNISTAGGFGNLSLNQTMIGEGGQQVFPDRVTVTVQSLSTYNFYAGYKMDTGDIGDLTDNQNSFLSLDNGSSSTTENINYHEFNGNENEMTGDGSNLTQLVDYDTTNWGSLNGGVDIDGQAQEMGLYLDLGQLNDTNRSAEDSYTFHIGFFVEEV